MEKSFEWIDPAEPLLTFFAHCHGATIIDSDQPFTAPHIVIQEAPLQSPWEIEEHKTVYPQDSGFGYYLMIPGVHEDYIINSVEPTYDDPFTDDATPAGQSDAFEECDLATESDSSLDSLELDTPNDIGLEGFSLVKEVPVPNYDEDEDELPSLDDEFYQSTARRYGLDLNAL
ncbi:hypothetical protein EW026_g5528 [Hermanssonia centrifuga]|uniref:Uncharacterized protein n=1 Tax=Hermanssonia centrifuga TaxID=98765 RepID=A0A4S4KI76_9APHY|nr:hypothetical protein EW026_g5528 [Hermanssonia centrifuga]